MRIVLEIIIILSLLFITYKVSDTIKNMVKAKVLSNKEKQNKIRAEIKSALASNSRYRIEDIIILYENDLEKTTKKALQARIDDLIISETDSELEKKL